MVKIGVFIEAIQVAVAQGAITAEVGAEAIKYYAEVGEFFLRRNAFDTATTADDTLLEITKRFQDAMVAIDVAVLSLNRGINESVTASEVVSKGSSKSFAEGSTVADTSVRAFGKRVTDPITAADLLERIASYSRAFTESLSAADVASRHTSKVATDSAATSEQGQLFLQNYAEGSYFAEGYIGTTTTF